MVKSIPVDDFLKGAADGGVIIDVRTPAEFAAGHIIGAENMPLFTNEERVTVGTLYVRTGRDEAIEKGLEFVGPRMAEMVRRAKEISKGRPIYIHCWRGGMRSGSVAWLLATAGLKVSVLKGGYKAYRKSFERMLEEIPWKFVLLSGATGCGKTELLKRLEEMGEQVLDLEGLANHKGSVFGGMGQPTQPTTEHFINRLHHKFREFDSSRIVWTEGESMSIGHVFMSQKLYELVRTNIQIEVEMNTEQRLRRLTSEYGDFAAEDLIEALTKIQKRFGPDRAKQAIEYVKDGKVGMAVEMALKYYDKTYKKDTNARLALPFKVDDNDMGGSAERLKQLVYQNQ